MKPFDKYQDVEQGGYAKFTGLKTYNKQLKTMIAIGGWNEASSRFSPLMANPERRQQFIKNILKFLRQNHFDGIDLDWEYPAQREGGKPRDRDNYAQFVQELRAEFERESQKTGRPRLLLTMAVPAGIENIEKGYDIPKLNKYLDWFNVLSYDFHSSHEPSANHHAPLYSLEEESEYNYDAELNIDYSIKYYLKAGADRDKLVLGIPTYGRSYTLINEESTEIGAPSEGPGEQGDATREKGYLAYYEICQNLKEDPEWTVVQPNPNAMGPYAYRRNQWVGYDDEAIVRKKAQYVVENGLGGIMFWAIDNDDFRGTCNGKPYPLIEAAKDAMLEGLGLGINEVAKPNSPKKPSRSRSRENSSSKLNRIGGSSEGKGSASRTTLSSGRRRIQSSTTTTTQAPETTIRLTNPEGSSLYIGGRVTTPAPPTTPDPGTDFKCEEEGFFQHPRDCKKYYWCLDSGPSGLGIVGHQFTCPSGLYFNPAADSCDFARNVPCKTKKATTAAPVTSTTTTTTTPRPTASLNRISAATSRTSFFRTTTTTTSAPEEYEEEEEEEVEDVPAHTKDRDAEEDPQVIKELIELIRKVGGLEELEKHLQHKDDGSISIKGSSSESGVATTPTPISKNLYDKVLSKPNTFNSFRNRFTSSSLFRKSGQTKTEGSTSTKLESEESQSTEGASSSGYSKYSSVVRGNSRQGPQNEGLDKLSEFDGFLKEKKQYVTINRHRGAFRGQDDEDEVEEKQTAEELNENTEEEELISRSKTTKRPTNTVTPSYASIKRTRPTTLRTESDEEAEGSDEEVKTVKESEEKRTYTSLNRNRGRFTTTESSQPAEEIVTNSNRYKYLERTRPTNRLQTSASSQDDDEVDQEDEQNDNGSVGERTIFTTPQTPTTTLLHVFTQTDDEQTKRPPTDSVNIIGRLVPERARPKHKVVEINRIVEITSKAEKLRRKSKSNQEFLQKIEESQLQVESLPHLEQLGEISVVKFVHLVDGSDISVDGHSTVTDYTPTEPTASAPVRNSLPEGVPYFVPQYSYSTESAQVRTTLEQRNGKALIPEVIRSAVESSTISLEGLFEGGRQGKELNSVNNVYYIFGTDETTTTSTVNINENANVNENETQNIEITTPSTSTSSSLALPTTTTLSTTETSTTTTTASALPLIPHSDSVINIPNEVFTNLESTTIVGNIVAEDENTTIMPLIANSSTIEATFSQYNANLTEVNSNLVETTTSTAVATEDTASTDTAVKSSTYVRTPTATTIVTATAQTRRPVLSVRRRKINLPNVSSGIAYQTATTSLQTSQTAAATTTTATANADASTKSDELLIITTELPTTTFNKQQLQRNRNKLVTPAATATTTDDLSAPTTTQFTAAAITLNNANNNQKSYLNTKYRAKLVAAGLSTISASLATETPNVDGAAAAATTRASNDIIQQANVNTNTKQPSTVLRRKFQARRLITTTTASATDDSATEQPRTPNPLFKRRFSLAANPPATTILTPSTNTPADALTTTLFVDGFDAEDASDQVAKSSVHTNHFNQFVHNAEDNEAQIPPRTLTSGIKASPLKSKSHIAVTTTPAPLEPQQPYVESITRRMGTVAATTEFTASKRKSVANKRRPQKYTPPTPQTSTESLPSRRGQSVKEAVNRRRPNKYAAGDSFERLNGNQAAPAKTTTHVSTAKSSHRQVVDYDYYDDENERVVGNTEGQQLKVILHGRGIIECLDQGNFPHPLSCRKFISCAKFETGGVVGWEYTCPKGLSYDPVGGMCNWAAGLGCKE
ncbi:serine-rich adhesin for platelets isoform X1 [Bactrocera tryoni]|uniref:serine-rich adhesin for platelets isoform X1 n=1 Tax=Bactrocera tryoni TaxID=59916 RepID=UPI001A97E050|nr:serine-rich adhesin for platelets isoform X1 [Bactrocera tryoni]